MGKKIAVLGATGSIGKNTLDVVRRGDFETVLLSAHTGRDSLINLKKEFPNALLVLSGTENSPPPVDYSGRQGLLEAIKKCGADIVVNGIAGAGGLEPSIAALSAGCRLALANKETIVMAGPLIFDLERKNNAKIIPVDSEHSAIFNLMEAHGKENIDEIILTASGGPFRNYKKERLEKVTLNEALAHPTWNMGPKITVDSATLANKGLEVIEASLLFGFPPEKIKVLIHKQSVVHSLIRLKNGMVYAQLSRPDMRFPIANALYWPDMAPAFDNPGFEGLSLDFEKPDTERFPMLAFAYEALKKGPYYPAIYNAANEIAAEAFLEQRINFLEIPEITGYVLDNIRLPDKNGIDLAGILETDKTARETALALIGRKKKC